MHIIYIYILANWLTIVKGNLKAPCSIATAPRDKGRHNFYPWIALLTFGPYLMMLSVNKYHFFLILWYEPTQD